MIFDANIIKTFTKIIFEMFVTKHYKIKMRKRRKYDCVLVAVLLRSKIFFVQLAYAYSRKVVQK